MEMARIVRSRDTQCSIALGLLLLVVRLIRTTRAPIDPQKPVPFLNYIFYEARATGMPLLCGAGVLARAAMMTPARTRSPR
jgi:hypothetical protein